MKKIFALLVLLCSAGTLFPHSGPGDVPAVYVDSAGVMRWSASQNEVSLFGVNYTVPFAYAYRAHERLGLSQKKAIDLDVAQMKRLGFDAFRVHVWDKEITDSLGNLLANAHLDLFDYLIATLSANGIKIIVTPIAWWGTGWPEPDPPVAGFTKNYSKLELITDPIARASERMYLKQFITHVNPYTKLSYRDDPQIIAVEIVNEPRHPDSALQVTAYINEMAGVLRDAGVKKPIFYNISETWSTLQANAVANADIDGVTFQWYPTGLVHGSMLHGNYLPNVDRYRIPSDSVAGFASKTKIVYEFDAADIGGSYMYPAMARSFREAGMQCAAMFSYDPVQIAWSNTEYPTHFVNLLYAPSKAMSLMIAGKAFHALPRGVSYGAYPADTVFGDFRVSYDGDLSEMNAEHEFYYSNSTRSMPRNTAALLHVAGCGSSPMVHYDGTGAYFLDKISDGIWRLEVYPDALWLRDPFGSAGMSSQVSRLYFNRRTLRLALPDLGEGYVLHPLNGKAPSGDGAVVPGAYLVTRGTLTRGGIDARLLRKEKFLDGLYHPPPSPSGIAVVNQSDACSPAAHPGAFAFEIAGDRKIASASLYMKRFGWRGYAKLRLTHLGGFAYALVDTPAVLQPGLIEYCVVVESEDGVFTFPGEIRGEPSSWDVQPEKLWQMNVLGTVEDVVLIDALRSGKDLIVPHFTRGMRYALDVRNAATTSEPAFALSVSFSDGATMPFACQCDVSRIVKSAGARIAACGNLVLRCKTSGSSPQSISLTIMTTDGNAFGADVVIPTVWMDTVVPLSTLRKRPAMLLPASYPLFLDTLWNGASLTTAPPDVTTFASIQIGVNPPGTQSDIRLEVASLRLTK